MRSKLIAILITCFFVNAVFAAEKLVFVVDLFRHGDRTPIHPLTPQTHHWKEGLGQLTSLGVHQQTELGKKLRKRYIEELKLLPPQYQSEMLYVRSTNTERTLMSAEAFLTGFYPTQSVPVDCLKKNDVLLPTELFNAKLGDLIKNHIVPTKEWQKQTAQTQPKWAEWSQATGLEIKSLRDVCYLADTLSIHQIHQAPLPKNLNEQDIAEIIAVGKMGFPLLYQHKEAGTLFGKDQLALIYSYLNKASGKEDNIKCMLLFTHDTTLATLLTVLQVSLNSQPPYASHLSFALYDNDGEQYIKVHFNDKPLTIPACQGEVCTLEKIHKLL